jgi:hypothetical protein
MMSDTNTYGTPHKPSIRSVDAIELLIALAFSYFDFTLSKLFLALAKLNYFLRFNIFEKAQYFTFVSEDKIGIESQTHSFYLFSSYFS